jgi:hypothetical protein
VEDRYSPDAVRIAIKNPLGEALGFAAENKEVIFLESGVDIGLFCSLREEKQSIANSPGRLA